MSLNLQEFAKQLSRASALSNEHAKNLFSQRMQLLWKQKNIKIDDAKIWKDISPSINVWQAILVDSMQRTLQEELSKQPQEENDDSFDDPSNVYWEYNNNQANNFSFKTKQKQKPDYDIAKQKVAYPQTQKQESTKSPEQKQIKAHWQSPKQEEKSSMLYSVAATFIVAAMAGWWVAIENGDDNKPTQNSDAITVPNIPKPLPKQVEIDAINALPHS